jgi:hypothetical protein
MNGLGCVYNGHRGRVDIVYIVGSMGEMGIRARGKKMRTAAALYAEREIQSSLVLRHADKGRWYIDCPRLIV